MIVGIGLRYISIDDIGGIFAAGDCGVEHDGINALVGEHPFSVGRVGDAAYAAGLTDGDFHTVADIIFGVVKIRHADGVDGIAVPVGQQHASVVLQCGGERADIQRRDKVGHGAFIRNDDVLFYPVLRYGIPQRNAGALPRRLRDAGILRNAYAVGRCEGIGVRYRPAGKGLQGCGLRLLRGQHGYRRRVRHKRVAGSGGLKAGPPGGRQKRAGDRSRPRDGERSVGHRDGGGLLRGCGICGGEGDGKAAALRLVA